MKTIESFPYLIDDIFGDLEAASRITIDCGPVDENNPAIHDNLQVISVNGMNSDFHFFHYMKHLKAGTIEKFRGALPQTAPDDGEVFMDYALRRMRKIGLTVAVTRSVPVRAQQDQTIQWSLRPLTCRYKGHKTLDPQIIAEALRITRRHAWIYYLVIRRLEDRINSCAGIIVTSIVSTALQHKTNQEKKFRLSCTADFIGATLRVLCDRNLLEEPNVDELCRRMAGSVYTHRQDVLSPKSMRNSFDNPTPESLEKVLTETRLIEKYILKFIEQQRR
jgi:hypothetical protein